MEGKREAPAKKGASERESSSLRPAGHGVGGKGGRISEAQTEEDFKGECCIKRPEGHADGQTALQFSGR